MKYIFDYFQKFKIEPAATLSILLSLLTFSLAFLFNWISREIGRRRERKSYRRSMKFAIINLAKSCRRQSDIVRSSLAGASLLANKSFIINYTPISSLSFLYNTDYNIFNKNCRPKWYHSKKKKHKYAKRITQLFDYISLIKGQQEDIKEIMQYMLNTYRKHEDTYSTNLQNLKLTVIKYIAKSRFHEANQIDSFRQMIQDYNDVFTEWQNNGAVTGYLFTYPQIVQRIKDLNNKYSLTDMAIATIKLVDLCTNAYINVEKVDQYLNKTYSDFSFFHRKASRLLSVIAKGL